MRSRAFMWSLVAFTACRSDDDSTRVRASAGGKSGNGTGGKTGTGAAGGAGGGSAPLEPGRIFGFGVNGQPRSWGTDGSAVKPVLDQLVSDLGANFFRVETWMGGTELSESQEDEFVETLMAVLVYARTRAPEPRPRFSMLTPLNEPAFFSMGEGFDIAPAPQGVRVCTRSSRA